MDEFHKYDLSKTNQVTKNNILYYSIYIKFIRMQNNLWLRTQESSYLFTFTNWGIAIEKELDAGSFLIS